MNEKQTADETKIIKNLALMARTRIAFSDIDFAEWSAEIRAEFGNRFDTYLKKAWDRGEALLEVALEHSSSSGCLIDTKQISEESIAAVMNKRSIPS